MIQKFCHLIAITMMANLLIPCHASLADDGARYRHPVFKSIDEFDGVVFGHAQQNGQKMTLRADVLTPRGDTVKNRPLFILAFGGGFTGGSRKEDLLRQIGTGLTLRGYVTALIDYRLFERQPNGELETYAFALRAVQDMQTAIRFFRKDATQRNRFGIDGRHIISGGISAGAVVAAIAGFLDDGDQMSPGLTIYAQRLGLLKTAGNNSAISSRVAGVLSISGGLPDVKWIDRRSPPLFAAHEVLDPVVPCASGIAATGSISARLSGGCAMNKRAAIVGLAHAAVITKSEQGHVGYNSRQLLQIINGASQFFARQIAP